MKYNLLAIFAMIIFLSSCDSTIVVEEFTRDFDDNRWQKTDAKSFNFTLKDSIADYDMIVDFSHVAGFQFGIIPIKIDLTMPDGRVLSEHMLIQIKDSEGNDRGDCTGDYCDVEQVVFEKRQMKAGSYKVTLKNEFDSSYLPNVLGVGIKVKRSEAKK